MLEWSRLAGQSKWCLRSTKWRGSNTITSCMTTSSSDWPLVGIAFKNGFNEIIPCACIIKKNLKYELKPCLTYINAQLIHMDDLFGWIYLFKITFSLSVLMWIHIIIFYISLIYSGNTIVSIIYPIKNINVKNYIASSFVWTCLRRAVPKYYFSVFVTEKWYH